MKKVVLIIGNRYQPNACGFIREFEKTGKKIEGILCLESKREFMFYAKIPFRIIKILTFSNVKYLLKSIVTLIAGKQQLNTLKGSWNNVGENSWDVLGNEFDIIKYAREKEICVRFSPFLSATVIDFYTKNGPVIFPMYAGGILSKKILTNPNAEFINAHMGSMPRYRGMNVIEWAILEHEPPKVAVMVMNEVIDGGDVMWQKDIDVSNEQTIKELRTTGYMYCYIAMAEGVSEYLDNNNLRKTQENKGKYYYRMHSKIRELTEMELLSRSE